MYDGEIKIDTKIDTSGLDKGVNEVKGKLTHSIKGLSSIIKGAGFAAAFAGIAKTIRDVAASTEALENSIRKASTLFGDVSVNVDNLRDKMLQLSSETGIAAEEIGGALYEALSSGVPATEDMAEAMEFLRSSAQAAIGGFADLEGTVTATAAVINAYGLAWEDAERVQGVLIQTQNKGMTTIGQLSNSLARVIPTAASFGVSLEQIGAALATTTAAGTQTDEAITGLNSLLSELGKQGQTGAKGLTEAAKAAGLGERNFQDLIDDGWTLADILTLMSEYASSTDRTLIDMFGSIEAGRTALQLAGENAGRFADNLESMYDTAGLTAAAAEAVTTNTERLGLAIENAGSKIGQRFEPAVQGVAGVLADMVNSLAGNRDRAREVETAFNNLMTASDNLKAAQDGAKESTEELTAALEAQASATYHSSLLTFVQSYQSEADRLDAVREQIAEKYGNIEADTATFNEIMAKYGNDAEFISDAYELMLQGFGSEDISRMMGSPVDVADLEMWNDVSKAVLGYKADIEDLRIEEENLSKSWSDYAREMAEAIRTGKVGISDLMAADNDLYQTVMALNDVYSETFDNVRTEAESLSVDEIKTQIEEATRAISDDGILTNEAYEKLQAKIDALQARFLELTGERYVVEIEPKVGQPAGGGKKTGGSGGSGGSASVSIAPDRTVNDVWNDLLKRLDDANAKAKIFGDSFDLVRERTSAVTEAVDELIEDFDLDPASEDAKMLRSMLEGIAEQSTETAEELESGLTRSFEDIRDEWNANIANNIKLSEIFGDDFNLVEAQIKATENAIRSLVTDLGFDESSEEVQYLAGTLDILKQSLEETADSFDSVDKASERTAKDVMDDWNESIGNNVRLSEVFGEEFNLINKQIRVTEDAIEELMTKFGFDKESETIRYLSGTLDELRKRIEETSDALEDASTSFTASVDLDIETPESVIKELSETMMDNGRLASIMGDSFNLAEADIAAMTEALKRLVTEFDLDDSNESVQNLIDSLEILGVSFDSSEDEAEDWKKKLSDWLKELGDEMEQWASQAATSFAQSVGAGIEDLVVDLMTIDEQVESLKGELTSAQEALYDSNERLSEQEEEYRLALLEGNEEAIASALEQLELAQETQKANEEKVRSLEDEIEATESGAEAWASFGKAALLALADVLEGLGAQLAAQAVAALFTPATWGQAALATAASAAAYVAAGLVRGWAGSYAEGGIVPKVAGVPDTGDRHIASVNPGELILNRAQQDNIASLLSTQEAMLDLRRGAEEAGQRTIVVEITGDIYGLDSEEVGRAVYRNIRSLQEEGRLDRWR